MAMSHQFLLADMRAAVALAAVAVASCTSSSESLQQVRASNPSVTYEYAGDDELLEAQQNAVAFCSQYQAGPRPARIMSGTTAGSNNTVVFECDPNLPTTAPPEVVGSDFAYTYQTDQELLQASQNAHTYCIDNGWQQAVPSIRTNSDGSRTVVFQCA
jgi:hypothetical protein